MFQIERIVVREVRLKLREPFRISSGTVDDRRTCLLELHGADGTVAWSESVAFECPNYSSETVDSAWFAITNWFAPRVLGRPFDDPREVAPVLARHIRGHRMALAAVEMGCWDMAARVRGVPLATLLGGTRDRVATGISLGMQRTPADLVTKTREALELGYRKIKMKIGPGADVDYVRAVREELGPEAPLMADANSAYTLADADHLAELDPFDLMMIEQPLAHDDLVRHAELARRIRTPICLDETITGLDRTEDMATLGSGSIVNIKPGRVGGLASSLAIHDFCHARGFGVWCGGMLESGIGRAYNVALASLPGFTLPGDLSPSARYWASDVVTPEWTMDSEGMVAVPLERPGIGVEVDRDRVESITTRVEVLEASGAVGASASAEAAPEADPGSRC